MASLDKIRIFLKDELGNHYRICSVSNPADRRGEYYIKIMFPDIKGIPLITGHHNKGDVTPGIGLFNGVQEFTYHYRSGVSHFKDSVGKVDSKKSMPTLINNPALHLLRYTIRSLDIFEMQHPSKISTDDFVLPNPFDGKPRAFEFAVSKIAGPWNVINEQGKEPVVTHKISLTDPNASFYISDAVWHRPPMGKEDTLFEIFTHDNPVEVFTFTPMK